MNERDVYNSSLYYAKGQIQLTNCLLCNRKISSTVKSHIIPQFILKKISYEGKVLLGVNLDKEMIKPEISGIKNAMIVRLLCEKCDNVFFKIYESTDALDSFSIDDENTKKKKLVSISIKTNFAHIYYKSIVSIIKKKSLLEENYIIAEDLDVSQHFSLVKNYKRFFTNRKSPFHILHEKTLSFFAGISCQAMIALNYDLEGNKIFESTFDNIYEPVKYLNIIVLPYSNKTKILLYYNKEDYAHYENFIKQFHSLSESEKIHLLFVLIITYTEYFVINPNLAKLIRKDKDIIKLYNGTDTHNYEFNYNNIRNAMINFRSYNNYISKEYGIEYLNSKKGV